MAVDNNNAGRRPPLSDDYAAAIKRLVDAAPPLTDEQRIRLGRLLTRSDAVD